MSGTIETTNNNIIIKINSVVGIIELFNLHKKEFANINIDCKIIQNIQELKEEYEMGSINILSNYFLIAGQCRQTENEELKNALLKKKDFYFNKYQVFIRKENFISKLDRIMNLIKRYIQNTDFSKEFLQEIYTFIKQFNNSTVDKNIKEVVYETCTCLTKMDIDPISSILICKKCGMTKKLYGTVFEDDQFYYQEGQRTKHGTYDPSKHCRFWVERIQARETTEINETVLQNIKNCIIRDKIKNKSQVTCNQIRKYLRQTHNSKYNEHVPLIRKLITGISPPQLTDYEMQLIHIYFDKVIHIFDEIKPPQKTNCPYHPYFIYKIIEQIINKDSDKIKKAQILSCIHLQSRETLIQNDLIWGPICSRIPEFKYFPTDRNNESCDK
jgi:hypothetical protein